MVKCKNCQHQAGGIDPDPNDYWCMVWDEHPEEIPLQIDLNEERECPYFEEDLPETPEETDQRMRIYEEDEEWENE